VAAAATALDREAVVINHGSGTTLSGTYASTWILVGSHAGFLGQSEIEKAGTIIPAASQRDLWTDDYSSLFRILK